MENSHLLHSGLSGEVLKNTEYHLKMHKITFTSPGNEGVIRNSLVLNWFSSKTHPPFFERCQFQIFLVSFLVFLEIQCFNR